MKKSWIAVPLVLAGMAAGCRSGGGRVAVTDQRPVADPLQKFVGQKMVLRRFGDRKDAAIKRGEEPKGGCDVAVQVVSAAAAGDSARFTLDSLGRLRVGGNPVGRCDRLASPITLTVRGVDAARPDSWSDVLASTLLTPEAYLASQGRPLPYAPEPEPVLAAAAGHKSGNAEERTLGRKVTSWPKPVLSVEPAVASPGGKIQHEGEVEFVAVVGADGRVFRPEVKTPLSDEHTRYIASVLQVWRFDPAKAGDKAVAARYEGRTVFKIY
jgi:hypothetical protein